MGYRSDVRIIISKKGYNELKKHIQKYYDEKNISKEYQFDLLNHTDIREANKYQVYLGWDNIKWYGYPDVDAIEEGSSRLKDNDYSYRFARLGEYTDDYEECYYDSTKEKEQNLDFPWLERYFNDDYIIGEMEKVSKKEERER